MEKFRSMFLCTGNSCRSQMAEGWARFLGGDEIDVRSAGIETHGQNIQAIKVMSEEGIDISQQESIRVNGEMLEWADLLVTLCENADEQCPVISPHTLRLHSPPSLIRQNIGEVKTKSSQSSVLPGKKSNNASIMCYSSSPKLW